MDVAAYWAGRWGGAACAVAGCAPMLATLVAGAAGAGGVQAMGMGMGMAGPMGTAQGVAAATSLPGWVAALGALSWPLAIVSAGLLIWSFWRTRALARAVAYVAVALLLVNQWHMTTWLFFGAMALLAAAFGLSYAHRASHRGAPALPAR